MDLISSSHEVSLFDDFGDQIPCAGTIISSYLILTLASCLYGKSLKSSNIKTNGIPGSLSGQNLTRGWTEEQIMGIRLVKLHPDFENSSFVNDIAILVLNKHVDLNHSSTAKVIPFFNMAHQNQSVDQSTFMNFRGRLCKENSMFSPLKISQSQSQCPSSALDSDKLCLLPLNSDETSVNSNGGNSSSSCSLPFPGSSLICSSKEHGQFLCGLLAASLGNITENGRVYTNVTHHSKWIQSVNSSFDIYNPSFVFEFNRVETEVKAGVPVDLQDPLPYQLSIQIPTNLPDFPWQHWCGAVILDETTAITAAHCFDNIEDFRDCRVVAGEHLLNTTDEGEQFLTIQELIIHLEYTPGDVKKGSDIAILHLETKIRFDKYSQSAWLSRFPTLELTNQDPDPNVVTISGWGSTSNKTGISNSLQKGNVSILSREGCEPRLMKQKVTGPGIWCALNRKMRTCRGDSGGPLVIQNFRRGNSTGNLLLGIVSFGATNCDREDSAVFFTETGHFYNWIQENRKKGEEKNPVPSTTPREVTHTSEKLQKLHNVLPFPTLNLPLFTPFPFLQFPSFRPLNFDNYPVFQPSSIPVRLENGPGWRGGVSSSSSKSCTNNICTESRTVIDGDGKVTIYNG